ncbi:MAG: hypothetical protein M1136_03835 [Chloroflexi bacterium]|nr:hypothetical protein [Chloroflexota bacterium]MCL5074770.1 hypothetical protein [Chloroflexota bacterium]
MARGLRPIDISNVPELLRIVEEVRRTDEARVLRRDDEDLAILMPAKPGSKHKPKPIKTRADYEAFCSAFGGWKGIVDADTLKRDLASARGSDRPPVRL